LGSLIREGYAVADEPEPTESTIPDSSLDKDPRLAMAAFWRRTVLFFDRFHSRVLAKYPRLLVFVDWLLEFLYVFFASPITALIVSLLLVPFVISGSIPIIVFCSVTMAWLLCVVAVARAEPVKQLSIIPRFVMVAIIALTMFGISRSYIRWTLLSYYAHLVPQVTTAAGTASPSPPVSVNIDSDQLGQRLDELLRKELRKLLPPPIATSTSVQTSPVRPVLPPEASLSTDELRAKVDNVSQQLKGWAADRRAAENELNNRKWLLHDRRSNNPSSVKIEEIDKNDAYWEKKLDDLHEKSQNDLSAVFVQADKLRKEMLRRLPQSKWTREDRDNDKDQLFLGISENSAADYLERLAKRI
jgi:hypothetical protein